MKYLVILPLLAIFFLTHAQEEIIVFDNYNRSQDFDWSGFVDYKNHTKRSNQFIESLGFTGIETGIPYNLVKDNRDLINHLIFVDLNADKIPEVIYSGPSGGEPNVVEIFFKSHDHYKRVFSAMQGIVKPYWSNNKLSKLLTHDWGCCAENRIINSVYEVNYNEDNEPGFNRTLQIVENQGLTKPKNLLLKPVRFTSQNSNYKLRLAPSIDDTSYLGFLTEHEQLGNTLGTIDKGTEGLALGKSKDETGRVWWYVVISTKFKLNNSVMFLDDLDENSYYVGWMSSRYLIEK